MDIQSLLKSKATISEEEAPVNLLMLLEGSGMQITTNHLVIVKYKPTGPMIIDVPALAADYVNNKTTFLQPKEPPHGPPVEPVRFKISILSNSNGQVTNNKSNLNNFWMTMTVDKDIFSDYSRANGNVAPLPVLAGGVPDPSNVKEAIQSYLSKQGLANCRVKFLYGGIDGAQSTTKIHVDFSGVKAADGSFNPNSIRWDKFKNMDATMSSDGEITSRLTLVRLDPKVVSHVGLKTPCLCFLTDNCMHLNEKEERQQRAARQKRIQANPNTARPRQTSTVEERIEKARLIHLSMATSNPFPQPLTRSIV